MFGSTIEYVLRNFTEEYTPIDGKILADGSMHSFKKEWHPGNLIDLKTAQINENSICTPFYPFEHAHLQEILLKYNLTNKDKCVLLYAVDLKSAELNILFQYYKIAANKGLGIFCGENLINIKKWNSDYTHWSDMTDWELREWFSVFYPTWVAEWINSPKVVPAHWKTISNSQLLNAPYETFCEIINFCSLTKKEGLNEFSAKWKTAQQYIVEEYNLLDLIIDETLQQNQFSWTNLNIISESILQQRLRSKGYEIMCNGLNTFPTNSKDLYNLLYKC